MSTEEDARIAELARYKILQTEPEELLDDITALAAQICSMPVALISFLANGHCFFKSRYNTDAEPEERDVAFCSHVVASKKTFIVNDTKHDTRFKENPGLASREIRFYAGAPLITDSGYALGSLCVIDEKPNALNSVQKKGLVALARHAVHCLEWRLRSLSLDDAQSGSKTFFTNIEADRRASLMKSQLPAYMSNEIRTPINGIVGCIELFQATSPTEEQRQLLEAMQESINGISRLTNDILDLAKIETEQLNLEASAFEPIKVFDSIQKRFQLLAARKNLRFDISVRPIMTQKVVGDAIRFDEIISNVVNNAIKFTDQGTISVTVENQSISKDEMMLFIQITDTGSGIPPEKMNKMFKSFSQVDDSHKRKYGGSGLSLSITKFLVEKMNGSIGVHSKVGKGTKFWIIVVFEVYQEPATKSGAKNNLSTSGNIIKSDADVRFEVDNNTRILRLDQPI